MMCGCSQSCSRPSFFGCSHFCSHLNVVIRQAQVNTGSYRVGLFAKVFASASHPDANEQYRVYVTRLFASSAR